MSEWFERPVYPILPRRSVPLPLHLKGWAFKFYGRLPASSPARWFRWTSRRGRQVKPADNAPNSGWCGDWVWDPDVNASYLSVWGCQPTTDYASPGVLMIINVQVPSEEPAPHS